MPLKMLTLQTTDLACDRFPDYIDSIEPADNFTMAAATAQVPANKLVNQLQSEDPSRTPSPQPTHFSVPQTNGNGHRVLRSATVGYIAPEFEGRAEQMKSGRLLPSPGDLCALRLLTRTSQGDSREGGLDPPNPRGRPDRVVLQLARH